MSADDEYLVGDDGRPLTPERMARVREAFRLLLEMSEGDRGLVLCWFCSACHRYVGPGDSCHCEAERDRDRGLRP